METETWYEIANYGTPEITPVRVLRETSKQIVLADCPPANARRNKAHTYFPTWDEGVESVFPAALLLHLGRFLYSPDPVAAGLVWVLAVLSQGQSHLSAIQGSIALAALVAGISATEHSHWIAYHDELTRLPGRRAFNQALAKAGDRYSVAVVDVDHFKSFNDSFGHDAGDQVLRMVAGHLARVGGGGTAYRCGGEEFALFFPGIALADAASAAEQVRR